MTVRSILVPIVDGVGPDFQLSAALNIARAVQAHINAIYIRADPADLMANTPEVALAPGVTRQMIDAASRKESEKAEQTFQKWRLDNHLADSIVEHSLHTPFACWSEYSGKIGPVIEQVGKLNDLAVIGWPSTESPQTGDLFDGSVFGTGRPVILVKKVIPYNILAHVLIAWNGSLEATRAVAGAMPLLDSAEQVSIFSAPSDDESSTSEHDLAKSLSWHGIRAGEFSPHKGESSAGAALLRVALEQEATLLIMGANTNSRFRQNRLGGMTNFVLTHAEMPVLMMH